MTDGAAPDRFVSTRSAGTDEPLLKVRGLGVDFGGDDVVTGLSFDVRPGACLALVGESGSGKSVTARSLIGLAGDHSRVRAESLSLAGRDLRTLRPRQWRQLRGRDIGFVLQDALVSLDPLRRVGREIDDALRLHTSLSPSARRDRVLELLEAGGIDDPALRAGQLSGELSGGMRQRALIASAVALRPSLLIADEPTTALDTTVQQQILALLQDLRDRGTAILLISHDLAVVRQVADDVAVMRAGMIVESGPVESVLGSPQHSYTRRLLAAVPTAHPRGTRLSDAETEQDTAGPTSPVPGTPVPTSPVPAGRVSADPVQTGPDSGGPVQANSAPADPAPENCPVLEVRSVSKSFDVGRRRSLTAVDHVSLDLWPGRTLGLVGESGSGKTTTARIALGLTSPDSGDVRLFGEAWNPLPESRRRRRRPLLGAIYQDALSSFDPRMSVGQILVDAAGVGRQPRQDRQARTAQLLHEVGLDPTTARRHPRQLSGGQRQRVSIARALAPGPSILLCDEPVSSLDVSVQARILDLLDDLQARLGLACLFISHDLGVIRHVSDDVAVMQSGKVVESGPTEQVFAAASHPYTQALLSAAPRLH